MPALNDLLTPYGAAFDSGALETEVKVEGVQVRTEFVAHVCAACWRSVVQRAQQDSRLWLRSVPAAPGGI